MTELGMPLLVGYSGLPRCFANETQRLEVLILIAAVIYTIMARPIFSTNPSFGFLEQTISTSYEKPLPPTPRRPSSAYSVAPDEKESPYGVSIVDQYFASELLQPKTYRASTSKLPDRILSRPKLLRDPELHAASDPIIQRRKAEQGRYGDNEEIGFSPNKSRQTATAKEHADDYESVLHTKSSFLPTLAPDPYYSSYGHLPSAMSPRITDVVDQSLVPSPLRFSTVDYNRVGSRFSSDSSSDAGSCHSGLRDTVQSYARQKFSKRSVTPDAEIRTYLPLPLPPKPKSRLGSIASQKRASIQHGIEEMYDTLTSFTRSPLRHKPPAIELDSNRKARIPRERRSPAIPLTPYQLIGAKAFEDTASSKSSKTSLLTSLGSRKSRSKPRTPTSSLRSPARSRESYSQSPVGPSKKRPIIKKLAAVLSSGTTQVESAVGLETNRVKRSKSEKRRAELKKKITVLGIGDHQAAGDGRWV